MKNQYFGDISFYKEIGILRSFICDANLNPLICWMLTKDDDSTDGNNIKYLFQPLKWRKYDPELYDFIQEEITSNRKPALLTLENSSLMPGISFYNDKLKDNLVERKVYFENLGNVVSEKENILQRGH